MWYPEQHVGIGGQIDRIDKPSKEVFQRYVASRTPVIVRGALNGQKAWSTWTDQTLKDGVGDTECDVYVSKETHFPSGEDANDHASGRFVKMKLSECIERMSRPRETTPIVWPNERYYPYMVPSHIFDPILDDLVLADLDRYSRKVDERNLWISQAGHITFPHIDFAENLLTQISGRKGILLWDPAQWSKLYLHLLGDTNARQSQIDITKPDVARFPLFLEASALEGVVEAGDGLYIPFGFIHSVHSDTFSISVNYWWGSRRFDRIRNIVTGPLLSYCAHTPWVSFKLFGQGVLRRLSGRANMPYHAEVVHENKTPAVIDTTVRLGGPSPRKKA